MHGTERVVHVGDFYDGALDGNCFTGQAGWITAPIPALVMGKCNVSRHVQRGRITQDFRSHQGVFLDDIEFVARQPERLIEEVGVDANLAHVVELRGIGNGPDKTCGAFHPLRHGPGILVHAADVRAVVVLRIRRHGEGTRHQEKRFGNFPHITCHGPEKTARQSEPLEKQDVLGGHGPAVVQGHHVDSSVREPGNVANGAGQRKQL